MQRWQGRSFIKDRPKIAAPLRRVALLLCAVTVEIGAYAQVDLPAPRESDPIFIQADTAQRWTQADHHVWRLEGRVQIVQGSRSWTAGQAVLWVDQPNRLDTPTVLSVYLEAGANRPVRQELFSAAPAPEATPIASTQSPDWAGELRSTGGVTWNTPPPENTSAERTAIVARALAKIGPRMNQVTVEIPTRSELRDESVEQAQFLGDPFQAVAPAPEPIDSGQPQFRSVLLTPRYGAGLEADLLTSGEGESVGVLTGGARLVIAGVDLPGAPTDVSLADQVIIEADRVVVWTAGVAALTSGRLDQTGDTPLELYLEGNIILREGERTILAERMFYDARRETGVILDAEILTPVPEIDGYQYRGLVRLKADAIRQLEDSRYVADEALFTTSRLEKPTYSLKSKRITFEDFQLPIRDPITGAPAANPFTGEPLYAREQTATAEGNRVEYGGIPLLFWPEFETDLREPRFYLDDLQVRNDSIFGFQILTDWDVHQLLGAKAPPGVDWTVGLDLLSERGIGSGTIYDYRLDSFGGVEGPARGLLDLWFIKDDGKDNLGFGRRSIEPEEEYRGRAFWDHRQKIRGGVLDEWTSQFSIGWISDRTFLEQYYEREWDEQPDQATGVRFRRTIDNQSLSIEANAQVNDFFTETQWLPRLDHWLMGQDLAGDRLTWFAHSQVAYANQNPADTPTSPDLVGDFFIFDWEADVQGERAVTRQEIDLPIDLAPVKVVPFVLGEVAHWGDSIAGGDLQRAYIHTGVRASAPFWAVNPAVRDELFNLNGLAHKVVFEAEASYADSSRNIEELTFYDEFEDNTLEEIRRRTFFPVVPATSDPRFWLVRSGMQGWVAAPTVEAVDDLSVVRLGMRNRLQTKRGALGDQRVVDWLTLDTNLSVFPDGDNDNFGETLGLVDYDLAWHLGDRFTFLSDGFIDLFTDGLETFSAGVAMNRPTRGNAYVGYRTIRGPFNSDLLSLKLNYRFGPKWAGSAATVIDFGEAGNIGQTFALSRIGESLLFTLGLNVDQSKDNVGVSFLVEPRFLPSTNFSRRTGIDVPPAGAYGLE